MDISPFPSPLTSKNLGIGVRRKYIQTEERRRNGIMFALRVQIQAKTARFFEASERHGLLDFVSVSL
jgi:hypothetical protein